MEHPLLSLPPTSLAEPLLVLEHGWIVASLCDEVPWAATQGPWARKNPRGRGPPSSSAQGTAWPCFMGSFALLWGDEPSSAEGPGFHTVLGPTGPQKLLPHPSALPVTQHARQSCHAHFSFGHCVTPERHFDFSGQMPSPYTII